MAKLVIKQTGVAGVTESDGLNYTVLPVYTWPTAGLKRNCGNLFMRTRNSCDPCASRYNPLSLFPLTSLPACLLVRLARSSHSKKTPLASLRFQVHPNGDATAYITAPRAKRLSEKTETQSTHPPTARLRGAWRRRGWTR